MGHDEAREGEGSHDGAAAELGSAPLFLYLFSIRSIVFKYKLKEGLVLPPSELNIFIPNLC